MNDTISMDEFRQYVETGELPAKRKAPTEAELDDLVARGKASVEQGKDLESALTDQCDMLRRYGRADVEKKTNPLRIIRPLDARQFVCVKTKSETVDFNGTIKGGRAVYFEAKSTRQADRFPFALVGDAQIDFMRRHAALDGIAFLYAASLTHGREYVLPVDSVGRIGLVVHKRCADLFNGGRTRESIRWDAMRDEWRVRPGEVWLDTVQRLHATGGWPYPHRKECK